MPNKRKEWIEGVREMLETLKQFPHLPIPKMSSDSTFVAMVTEPYPSGYLLRVLENLTFSIQGATQEFYNFTPDKLPEMDRIRLVWMFGTIRYELDAPVSEVFGPNPRSVLPYVNFIGENVNTIILPDPSE